MRQRRISGRQGAKVSFEAMRALARSLLALIVLVLLAAGGAYFYLQRSLPQTEGTLRVAGPHAPIEILRDAYGIPHIFARNTEDAAFGLGFVHAQDRLWQMEMSRRIAAGRLAEILGPAALPTDEFLRTLGIHRAAQATLAYLEPETLRALEAYAAGVNAFIATRPVLPIEFWLTRDRFAPWTPADTIGWVKMMAWELGGNWRTELLRMRLAKTLSPAQIEQLLPPYPGDAPLKIRDLKVLYGGLAKQARALARIAPPANGPASNNWVVSGAHSATGKPLLANDPHLGLSAPSVWYLAQISAPGLDAIGATFPGVPMVVLGHNDRIAWGFTNTGPDVQDLYIEKLDGHGNYLTPGGWRPLTRIDETIKVRGGDDVHLTVRQTRHGPLISDVLRSAGDLAPPGYGIAMQWTALRDDDRTVEAGLKMLRAGNWKEFLAAVREFDSPQQNMVYADVDGHIGFIAAGRVPVRKPENDLHGLAPAPGWDAKYDWAGFIPFEQLPQLYDPPNGEIYSANSKITPPGYGPFITSEWEPPYRAKRIAELLAAVPRHTISSFARMQGDVVSLAARELLPRLSATHPASEQARLALELLAHWDGSMSAGRPEPLIFMAWWRELARAIYADELGDAFRANWLPRPVFLSNVLYDKDGEARWCDDVRTKAVETCDQQLSASLEAALADLRARYGKDMTRWRWGDAHRALGEHRPFGRNKWLARIVDIRVPTPGGDYTLDRGAVDFAAADPYANRKAPSLRAIYDLSDLQNSLFIDSTGQSGNVLSPHYRDFAAAWARGEYIPMITDRARLEAAGARRLVLEPAP